MDNIRSNKTVYKKEDFEKAVETEFSTFVEETTEVETDTVEEVFRLYDKLFYEIPVEGGNNSHEYIVKKSSELYKLTTNTEDIQPLLDEITQLREQLLLLNQQLIEERVDAVNNVADNV